MSWRFALSASILALCASRFCSAAIRFELPEVSATATAGVPTSGFFDVLVRANPSDLPQSVSSYNLDFHTTSASVTLGPPGIAPNALFSGAPDNFSPNAQTILAAQDSFPSSVALFDGAALVRVPYQVPAGVSGVFQLVFGTSNQLTNASAVALPLQTSDTGSITVTSAFPPGDYNHNGTVGSEDYAVWRATFGSNSSLNADGNSNSLIDAADYVIWRNLAPHAAGSGAELSAASASVPEPVSLFAVLVAVATFHLPRRRRL